MGIYDRDYYGQQRSGIRLRGPASIVGWLIAINVAVWLADGLLTPDLRKITINNVLSLQVGTLMQPWMWWKFLTYGFTHSPYSVGGFGHIAGNMIGLFFFGRWIEQRYGSREFLTFYLATIVLCGIIWSLIGFATQQNPLNTVIGASGAITAVVVLFIFLYPKQTVLLFFVIPMPAWVLGVFLVGYDLMGTVGLRSDNVAYTVHLTGAVFAVLYYKFNWRISTLFASISNPFKRQPNLRIHDPNQGDNDASSVSPAKPDKMAAEEDRLLAKIHRQGVESLTRKERKTLEKISRHYKERNQ